MIIAGSNTKISKTHRLFKKMLLSLSLSLCLLRLALPYSTADFFQSLDTVLREFYTSQVIIRAVFVFWFENDFLHTKPR